MRRINAAYELNALNALQRLADELPANDGAFPGATIGARIAWAAARIGRLEQVLATLKGDLARLRAAELHRLWERVEEDPTLLDRLADSCGGDIAEREIRLDALIRTYRDKVEIRVSTLGAS